jgi:hypothetical protein
VAAPACRVPDPHTAALASMVAGAPPDRSGALGAKCHGSAQCSLGAMEGPLLRFVEVDGARPNFVKIAPITWEKRRHRTVEAMAGNRGTPDAVLTLHRLANFDDPARFVPLLKALEEVGGRIPIVFQSISASAAACRRCPGGSGALPPGSSLRLGCFSSIRSATWTSSPC